MSKNKCQAKDPSTCRYHGTELRMNAAAAAGDLDTYFKERTKFEALTPETDQVIEKATEEGLGEFVDFKLFNPFAKRKNKKLEANSFSAQEFSNVHTSLANKKYDALETLNIEPNDKVAFSKGTTYGYSHLKREVYNLKNGKWIYAGYGVYDERDIARVAGDYGLEDNLTKAMRVAVLASAARRQLERRYRV